MDHCVGFINYNCSLLCDDLFYHGASSDQKLHFESGNTPSLNILEGEWKEHQYTVLVVMGKPFSPSGTRVCIFISLLLRESGGALSSTRKSRGRDRLIMKCLGCPSYLGHKYWSVPRSSPSAWASPTLSSLPPGLVGLNPEKARLRPQRQVQGFPKTTFGFNNSLEQLTGLRKALYLLLQFCQNRRIQIRTSQRKASAFAQDKVCQELKHEASVVLSLRSPKQCFPLPAVIVTILNEHIANQGSSCVQSFYWGFIM